VGARDVHGLQLADAADGRHPGASHAQERQRRPRLHLRRGSQTAPLVEGSRMVSRPIGLISMRFFMKQTVGPGWALVGDAGLDLDPTPGLGISDAARDALAPSEAIVDGSERAMLRYWRRRDADSIGLYHFAGDMSSEGYNNPFTRMLFARTQRTPRLKERMSRMMRRELRPLDMIPAATLLGWIAAETLGASRRSSIARWQERSAATSTTRCRRSPSDGDARALCALPLLNPGIYCHTFRSVRFSWDARKAAANLRKHGVSFEEAGTAFEDELGAYYPDSLHEDRFILIGYSQRQRLLYVVHAEVQRDVIRIISARKATKHEKARYEND
jgi:uncharacterized DUF497 family protein